MRFAFTEEQRLLQKSMRDLCERECDGARLRAAWNASEGRVPGLWAKLADLGVVGLSVPEAHDGMAMGPLDWVLVLEEAGRAALPEPLAETMAIGAPLLAEAAPELAGEWLPRVASGEAVLAVRLAPWPYVTHARSADLLLLEEGGDLYAVAPTQVELSEQRSVDGSRRLFAVRFQPEPAQRVAGGDRAVGWLEAARDRAAVAAGAQLVGLAARLLDTTVEYAKIRQQFGKPIGTFQAVKHHLANARVQLEFARPMVYRAAYSLEHADPEASVHASMAKAKAADAAYLVSRAALQVHAAIGYSFEYDLHLYMKRIWALATTWGDAAWHRERCAKRVLDQQPLT